MWGRQRFNTGDASTNSFWVAMLTFGEGWHNNHHAHPQSARHGLAWYEFDLNWYQISLLRRLRLASQVRLPRTSHISPSPSPRPWHAATLATEACESQEQGEAVAQLG
jgi:stearoyl-CoA desaturase (delta-9 desaturase)